jgi:hypothetical protein
MVLKMKIINLEHIKEEKNLVINKKKLFFILNLFFYLYLMNLTK